MGLPKEENEGQMRDHVGQTPNLQIKDNLVVTENTTPQPIKNR